MKVTEPIHWKIEKFADVGAKELFVFRTLELMNIVDATVYKNRKEIKEAIASVLIDSLMPAFLSLREIRKMANQSAVPVLTRRKTFEDFYKCLWTAYKERMQAVAKLMGYDIGFLFRKDSQFQHYCEKFRNDNPDVNHKLVDLMKHNRNAWQLQLARFRNEYLEHPEPGRSNKEIAAFYSLEHAESIFHDLWVAIEEVLAILLAARLPPRFRLREIPEHERNPEFPKRFGFEWTPV